MPASGQRISAENVAAPNPTPGQAPAIEALPTGWGSFRSEPRPGTGERAHYYASAPWNSYVLRQRYPEMFKRDREEFRDLTTTVEAPSWERLVIEVRVQTALYAALMAEVGE